VGRKRRMKERKLTLVLKLENYFLQPNGFFRESLSGLFAEKA